MSISRADDTTSGREADSTFLYQDSNLPGSEEVAGAPTSPEGATPVSDPVENFVNMTMRQVRDQQQRKAEHERAVTAGTAEGPFQGAVLFEDYKSPEGFMQVLQWGVQAMDVVLNKKDHYSAQAVAAPRKETNALNLGSFTVQPNQSSLEGMLGDFEATQFATPLEKALTKHALINRLLRRMNPREDKAKMDLLEAELDSLNFSDAVKGASTKIVDTAQSAMAHANVVPYQADYTAHVPCPSFGKETQIDTRHYKQALAAVGGSRYGDGKETRDYVTYLKTIRSICNLRYAPVACYDLTMYLFTGDFFEYSQIAARNGTEFIHFWMNFERMLMDTQKHNGNQAAKDLAKLVSTPNEGALSLHIVRIFNTISKKWEGSDMSVSERSTLVQYEARETILSYLRNWYPTAYPILKSEFDTILRQPGLDHSTFCNFSVLQALASKIIGDMRPIRQPVSRINEFESNEQDAEVDAANFENRGRYGNQRGTRGGRGQSRGSPRGRPISGFDTKCYLCGSTDGHTARSCRKYPGDRIAETPCNLCFNYHSSKCLNQTNGIFAAETERQESNLQ